MKQITHKKLNVKLIQSIKNQFRQLKRKNHYKAVVNCEIKSEQKKNGSDSLKGKDQCKIDGKCKFKPGQMKADSDSLKKKIQCIIRK